MRPKDYGWWGIKDIYQFGKAFDAKIIWRGLFSLGMWSEVIKDKYFIQRDVVYWIRDESRGQKGISNC